MSDTPHEIAEDFPEYREKLSELKQTDVHFKRLADRYHELNRTIHRGETDVEPMDDFHLEDLRKERVKLKDEIYGMLRG